eukprot:TRINITY_DN9276_c0_g2_i1.p1 TRINITY_DN9276_c0_g2~~TRINITY_DN9276_c0_g2_i1.p1  ORF type:complete len:359 (-),score=59.44 TRINITY_DN9276_c0_g2_i1:54-1130(-)
MDSFVKRLLSFLCLAQCSFRGDGASMQEVLKEKAKPPAELNYRPSWDEFYTNYVRKNRPVVLRGAMKDQPAYKLWTDEYLKEHFGRTTIFVETKKIEVRQGPGEKMTISQFLDQIYRPERKDELYALIDFDNDKRARSDVKMFPPLNCKEFHVQSWTLWMSAGGTSSVLHNDQPDNFLMLLDGTKKVLLVHQDNSHKIYAHRNDGIHPTPIRQENVDLEKFPDFATIDDALIAEMHPGDVLYIPNCYWHQVDSFGRNAAINAWWAHKDDWEWDPSNTKNFPEHQSNYGSPGYPKFDDLRARSPEHLNCTVQPEGMSFAEIKFITEEYHAAYLNSQRKKKKAKMAKGPKKKSKKAKEDL